MTPMSKPGPNGPNDSDDKITACLVIHNEESVIRRCLDSLKTAVDEIIVVHDGPCTDRSLEICEQYGCTVHVREQGGIGEVHRPWLLRQVKTDWVLQIDPDEYLSPEAQLEVRSLVASKRADCYALVWPLWDGKKYTTTHWPHKKVLYKKCAAAYLAVPHEEVRISGRIEYVTARLEHKPKYNNLSISTVTTKWDRWLSVHARALLADPTSHDRFPDHVELRPHYYVIAQHPLLSSVPIVLYHLAATVILGVRIEGVQALKLGLFTSLYYFALCARVYQLKKVRSGAARTLRA